MQTNQNEPFASAGYVGPLENALTLWIRPWLEMQFAMRPDATTMFNASVSIFVGYGSRVLFWDPWLGGLNVEALA
jgi:hypothetical protein